MSLRAVLLLALTGSILTLAALVPSPSPSGLPVLEWSSKAKEKAPPVAVLIEFGLKDVQPTAWPGRAAVRGATVVRREGYRFRDGDKLTAPDGWEARSRRAIGLPKASPALAAMEGMSGVGVVLHLTDVGPGAALTVAAGAGREAAVVPLAGVIAGRAAPIWDGAGLVRLVSTAALAVGGETEDGFPAAAYGPDGTLWLAYISYAPVEEGRRVEAAPLPAQPRDFKAFRTPGYGDRLWVKAFRDGAWGRPVALTDARQDLVGCAVAVEGDGTAWVAYAAQREGKHVLLARPVRAAAGGAGPAVGAEEALGTGDGRHLNPVACTDGNGTVHVRCQSRLGDGSSVVSGWHRTGGKWAATAPSAAPGRAWSPSVAAGPKGEVAVAYDAYDRGDYDVYLTTNAGADAPVAASSRFEARPSVAYDPKGRLWIAHEEGPKLWGKDYGALDDRGNPLYFNRTIRVVCLDRGKAFRPVAELPPLPPRMKVENGLSGPVERATRHSLPQVGVDGKGRVWLTYVQKFGTRNSTRLGSYWVTMARRLDGDRWTEPVELHHSDGAMGPKPVLLPHPTGGLRVFHQADGRHARPDDIGCRIYASDLDLPGEPVEPALVPLERGEKDAATVAAAAAEREAVARVRAYRTAAGGKELRLLRGEFHRHTEISSDGGPDGSLEDMFRYAVDAAELDWVANADHDNGEGREYSWWLTQKLTDAYHTAGHFTPPFGYERSVRYPHGHRNCLFAERGVRTLPRLAAPSPEEAVAGVHADDTKMLYRYLRETGGICASHTSATGMGTDWRDNDPAVEPVVEIYQGDRNSYEMPGAPRAGYDPKGDRKPAALGGWKPDGYINLALDRGYRLGFQASSDHWSTHISFCVVLAERHDRESILAALRQRHCYAATDNIVLDVRSGDRTMGDEFKAAAAPKLDVRVIGTGMLQKVEVLRDSKVVAALKPEGRELREAWTDPSPAEGMHYYYIRVAQADGELAWSSPMWIDWAK